MNDIRGCVCVCLLSTQLQPQVIFRPETSPIKFPIDLSDFHCVVSGRQRWVSTSNLCGAVTPQVLAHALLILSLS